MIHETIKNALGADLTAQVENALKGKGKDGKDLDLVVGNDGSFVPAEKYNGANTGKTSAENALKAAAEALKAIGGSGDPAKIADDVKKAQETISTLQTNHTAELAKIQKSTALKLGLAGMAHDPADVIALLNMDQVEVDDAGNLKTKLDDLIKPIRESKPYLFKEAEPANPDIKGAKPADVGQQKNNNQPKAADGPVIM